MLSAGVTPPLLAPSAPLLAAYVAATLVMASAVYFVVERRNREHWLQVAIEGNAPLSGPYRGSRVAVGKLSAAPPLIRATSLASLTFGQLFVPALVFAMLTLPFDGIAIALLPSILVALGSWWCGILLLKRSPHASQSSRTASYAGLLANSGLLVLCAVHAGLVEYKASYGIVEASNSVPVVAFVFAVASIGEASLLLFATRIHGWALNFKTGTVPAPDQ